MTVEELIAEIHFQHLEEDVFRHLSIWILSDREKQISKKEHCESTIRLVKKFADAGKSDAVSVIKDILDE